MISHEDVRYSLTKIICCSNNFRNYFLNLKLVVPPQDPGTGYRIVVLKEYGSNEEVIELNDVAFGDIWLCSGQSNMEFQLQSVFDAENKINNIIETTPEMRLFHVKHKTSAEPIEDLEDGDIQYNWGKAGDDGPNRDPGCFPDCCSSILETAQSPRGPDGQGGC